MKRKRNPHKTFVNLQIKYELQSCLKCRGALGDVPTSDRFHEANREYWKHIGHIEKLQRQDGVVVV